MKIIKLPLVATYAVFSICTQPLSAGNFVAYWDFSSDDKGEIDVGGKYDLTNSGGVKISEGVAVFDGTPKLFCTENALELSPDKAYTIECFVQAEGDCNGMIMELSANYTQNIGGFYIKVPGELYVKGSGGYNGEKFKAGTDIRGDGRWHHLAAIISPSETEASKTVQLYLDGVRQGNHVGNKDGSYLNSYQLYIGSRGGVSSAFKGKIDDVRITEGVLDPSEFMSSHSDGTHVRAYWKFDSDNPLADASGEGNVLQGSKGVEFANDFASFNGVESDVRTVDTLDLSDVTDMTFECFMRMHAGCEVGTKMILEHSANYWNNKQCFHVNVGENGEGSVRGSFRFDDGYRAGYSALRAVNAGWHHVALVKKSSAGDVSLYIDGVKQVGVAGESKLAGERLRNEILYIGSRANTSHYLDADIDDIRITAQALRPRQFLQTRTGAMEDVIAYWKFDRGSAMFRDSSGNGNTLTGTGVRVSDENAAVFDGSQRDFATLAPLPLYAYDSLTVEWFMKSSATDTGAVMESSVNYNNASGAFAVFVNSGVAGSVSGGFRMNDGFNTLRSRNSVDGEWHHYALIYDSSSANADIVRLYRDGVLVTEHPGDKTGGVNIRSDKLYIGARAGSDLPFVGELDDIKITGRVLSPEKFMKSRSVPPGLVIVVK